MSWLMLFTPIFNFTERIGDGAHLSVVYNNLGILAAHIGSLVQAEEHYKQV